MEKDKTYILYSIEYYDENIGDNNVASNVLSLRYANMQCTDDKYWIGGIYQSRLEDILKFEWDKEDVDFFAQEHPEVANCTFKAVVYDSDSGYGYTTISYVPRKWKIQNIIDDL
jgi:hypothetical protein